MALGLGSQGRGIRERATPLNNLPPSLVPQSSGWWLAVFLLATADLSGIIATFMPMKVILVLGSASVPGFLPQFMVDGGVVFTSFVLLALSAGFGFLSWLLSFLVSKWDKEDGRPSAGIVRDVEPKGELVREAKQLRVVAVSVILLIPVTGVIVLASTPYLWTTLSWIVLSLMIGARWQRSSRLPAPRIGSTQQTLGSLAGWLRKTALWSMVGSAVVTLLLAPPALGSTAILIAAIFGRRLTLALAEVLPQLGNLVAGLMVGALETSPDRKSFTSARPQLIRSPIAFLGSSAGSRELGEFWKGKGFAASDFRVVGEAGSSVLSLLAGPASSEQLLLRVFSTQSEGLRDVELARRQNRGRMNLFPDAPAFEAQVGGFPAIEIPLTSAETRVDLGVSPTKDQAVSFQVEQEYLSVLELDDEGVLHGWEVDQGELIESLEWATRIPGEHVEACHEMLTNVARVLEITLQLPPALVPQRPLRNTDFCVTEAGLISYLGGHKWVVGRMGDAWGAIPTHARSLREFARKDSSVNISIDTVVLNAHLQRLDRALRGFHLGQLSQEIEQLLARLEKIR